MIKPDPSKSRIADMFSNRFSDLISVNELEQLKCVGEPLFTEEEINETSWHLDKLVRKICVANHVTIPYFNEKYKQYALMTLGMDPTCAGNNRSNLYKALKAGNITYKRFLEVACFVLELEVEDVEFSFTDKKGSKQSYMIGKKRGNK